MKTESGADFEALSAQEYAAIHLRVEHPDLPAWLNEMIRKSRRDEFAKAAVKGLCARGFKIVGESPQETRESIAEEAIRQAAAMLKEDEK